MKAEELQKAACFRILHWIQTEEQKMGQAASQNRCPNEKKLTAINWLYAKFIQI